MMKNFKKNSIFVTSFSDNSSIAQLYLMSPSGAPFGSILDGRFLF